MKIGGRVMFRVFRQKEIEAEQVMMNRADLEWLQGRTSLGAAAGWTAEEIRLVADLGFALAEQGRNQEAISIFEGLAAIAPATAYFQSSLGALWLRLGDAQQAVSYLNAALSIDAQDIAALINRGEAHLLLGNAVDAIDDFETALRLGEALQAAAPAMSLARAKALLARLRAPHES
jgi:tetratricopeptide (TPR) repeat protein